MTKSDLKNGDIVKLKCGYIMILVKDFRFQTFILGNGYEPLEMYDEGLNNIVNPDLDIVGIRRPEKSHDCGFDSFEFESG